MEEAPENQDQPTAGAKNWQLYAPWIVAAVVFSVFLPLYYSTAKKRAEIFNTDSSKSSFRDSTDTEGVKNHVIFHHDQHVYMNLGLLMTTYDYDYFVPRQRMPGYPIILSLFFDSSVEPEIDSSETRQINDEMFARFREFNIILSMGLLVGLFFFAVYFLDVYASLIITWICGWGLFLFKCIYVQPELLFYTLFLMCFVLLWKQISKPTWTRGIIVGVLLAAAYFVKSAIPPLLLLFIVCFVLRRFFDLAKSFKAGELSWKGWFLNVGKGAIVPTLWLVLLSPYFIETAKVYGNPFWSVHSEHLMWQEDATTKKKWRILSDPEIEIPDDAPSFSNYWEAHKGDLSHFYKRPIDGAESTFRRIGVEYREEHLLIKKRILRTCVLIALIFFFPVLRALRKNWVETLYLFGFFLGYGILYGWMEMIRAGPRLMLSLFPCAVFILVAFIHYFAKPITIKRIGWTIPTRAIAYGVIALSLSLAINRIIGLGIESAAWVQPGGG